MAMIGSSKNPKRRKPCRVCGGGMSGYGFTRGCDECCSPRQLLETEEEEQAVIRRMNGRCSAKDEGARCALTSGHFGSHYRRSWFPMPYDSLRCKTEDCVFGDGHLGHHVTPHMKVRSSKRKHDSLPVPHLLHLPRSDRLSVRMSLVSQSEQDEEDMITALLAEFFNDDIEKVTLWLSTPNTLIGGIVPSDFLALRPGKLLKIVKQALGENRPGIKAGD